MTMEMAVRWYWTKKYNLVGPKFVELVNFLLYPPRWGLYLLIIYSNP